MAKNIRKFLHITLLTTGLGTGLPALTAQGGAQDEAYACLETAMQKNGIFTGAEKLSAKAFRAAAGKAGQEACACINHLARKNGGGYPLCDDVRFTIDPETGMTVPEARLRAQAR